MGLIPSGGIIDGQIIFAAHPLNIIEALNGVSASTVIINGPSYLLETYITGGHNATAEVSFYGTASWAMNARSSSYALVASTASYALTASFITASGVWGPYGSNSVISASNALSSSYANETDPIFVAKSASLATTGSNQFNGNQSISGSLIVSGAVNFPNLTLNTSSYIVVFDSASGQLYYTSSAGIGGLTSPASPTSSVQFNNGGVFGGSSVFTFSNALQQFTVTNIIASGSFTGSFTGSLNGTSSWAISASNAVSASYALTASSAVSSSYALTASYVLSASYALSSSYALSASYTLTASYAVSASNAATASFYNETDPVFVAKSASLATTGSNLFKGNQIISGNLELTGSLKVKYLTEGGSQVVMYDTASGQLYYTSSIAVGSSSGTTPPAGPIYSIQYNNSGAFGGIPGLTYSNAFQRVTAIDIIASGSFTGSFIGSLQGTASWAVSSSYALTASQAITASYISQSILNTELAFGKGGGQITGSSELTWNNLFPHFIGINSVSSSGVLISRNGGKSAGIILATNTGSLTASFRWAHFIDNDDNYAFRRYDDTGSFIGNTMFMERLTNRVNFPVLAGTGVRMVVADATGSISTQAIPTGSGGSSTTKAGTASIASFGGTPLTSSVTFGTAFSDTNYSISVLGQKSDNKSWTIESQAVGNFVINSNSNIALINPVFWIATPFNNS